MPYFVPLFLHSLFVILLVDENLDIVDEATNKHDTISGSQCVENIRRRLSPEIERRMFALIRSANDSSSDIAIYSEHLVSAFVSYQMTADCSQHLFLLPTKHRHTCTRFPSQTTNQKRQDERDAWTNVVETIST